MDQAELGLDEKIDRHGWALVHVAGHLMDAPTWTYTVGLTEREGLPELIVFDLDGHCAAEVLGKVRERLIADPTLATGGVDLGPADEHEDAPRLRLVDVADPWLTTYPLAARERNGPDLRVLQVVVDPDPSVTEPEPVAELSRLASQPHLDDPVTPWRVPVHPSSWWDKAADEMDLWVAVPITGLGEPEHRHEVIPARWTGGTTALLIQPPMLADHVNAGALVLVSNRSDGEFAIPFGPDARPVHELRRVIRPSPLEHLTFQRDSTDATFDALEVIANRFLSVLGTFGSQTVHVAVPPEKLEEFRRAMRPLERDGHVRAAPPYHAPIDVMDHADCAVCLADRPV